ncbi:MAG: hypothetical protein HC934_08895 [Acaryochloridaceae cyanobacterium SU_2_1]|nr:hypothetical protein [Acaryochloridaceae cyanobacterium SU_2_1]
MKLLFLLQLQLNYFKPHLKDEEQVSYHDLMTLDRTIISIVPQQKGVFGAGNPMFKNKNRLEEAAQVNSKTPVSVNNFAYLVSLKTLYDGCFDKDRNNHSAYTNSHAWLLIQTDISVARITAHRDIDCVYTKKDL